MHEQVRQHFHILSSDSLKQGTLDSFLNSKSLMQLQNSIKEQIILVLGWDGTMLHAIGKYHQAQIPFLWINFWHKGFLLNTFDSISRSIDFKRRTYPLIQATISTPSFQQETFAFNEIDIRSGSGRLSWLHVVLSGGENIEILWDWVILATPAGSTGYNSSLSGPILPHTLGAFVLTPKAPFKPKWQPSIVLDDREILCVKNAHRFSPLEIYADGKEVLKTTEWDMLEVILKKSKHEVSLLISDAYQQNWDTKVLQEQWFSI